MNKILENFDKDFLTLPLKEELFIANNIKLEKSITKNRALFDRKLSLFITINNKVPIIIDGKPGCRKSLGVLLINQSMKRTSLNNFIFIQYPEIIINSYQCSMGRSSKNI